MKFLNYILLFIMLISFGMSVDFSLKYDPYVELNTPTTINYIGNETTTSNPVIVYEIDYNYLNTTDNQTFYINLLSDVENQFDFTIYEESNESVPFFGYDTQTGTLSITDDTIYMIHSDQRTTPIISSEPRNILVCPNINTNGQDRMITYYVGIKNGTDEDPGLHIWESIQFIKNYNTLSTSCEYMEINIPYINYTLHSAIQCNDCNPGLILNLGIGDNIINASHYYTGDDLINTSTYLNLNYDLMISMHDEFLNKVAKPMTGSILFTESYDVTIDFINNGNLTENLPEYDYIYLQKKSDSTNINKLMDDLLYFTWIDELLDFENLDNIDTTLSFWNELTANKGVIKLYEPGNYTVNLIKAKVYQENYWDHTFLYPQNDEFSYSKNIANIEIKEKVDTTIEIHLDAYEIDKTSFTTHLIRNIFILLVYFICIIVIGLLSKSAWVTGAIGTITLPIIIRLLGL